MDQIKYYGWWNYKKNDILTRHLDFFDFSPSSGLSVVEK